MKYCDEARHGRNLPTGHAFCEGLPGCRFRTDEELSAAFKGSAPTKTPRPETPGGAGVDRDGHELRIGDAIEFTDEDGSVILTGYINDRLPAVMRWRCSTEEGAVFYAPGTRLRYTSGF